MYIPSSFAQRDAASLRSLIADRGFATLVTTGAETPTASHLPLVLADDGSPHGVLLGHMARANPQWRQFDREALAVFAGPHAYVSPTWYAGPDHVPTWNYAAVHAYGIARPVGDARALEILELLVARYEPTPWKVADLPAEKVTQLVAAIVAFEIPIARLEGKWKVGQNREPVDRAAAADALAAQGGEAAEVAALMRATLDPVSARR
jgi:transcriptional regulator